MLIASADATARRRWRRGLPRLRASHEVAEHTGLTRSMEERPPDILLLDLALPGLGGVVGVPAVGRLSWPTRILCMASAPSESEGAFAMMAGASGYCPKDVDAALLRKAVKVVRKGELWVSRRLTHHLLGQLAILTDILKKATTPARDSRLEALTSRQREIVKLLAGGASNKEIAKRLDITERTVKTHLTAVFRKLGVPGRLRLALLVKGGSVVPN